MFDNFPPHLSFMIDADQSILDKEKLFNWQLNHLSNALLIDDYNPYVVVESINASLNIQLKFPKDTLLSGSFVMSLVAGIMGDVKYDDIDIYFKTKERAQQFCELNNITNVFPFNGDICTYGHIGSYKVNLIYGVEYDSPSHLISRFDFRACSMAFDPNSNLLYLVQGAVKDLIHRNIVFNPVPRNISVRRFVKYINKGFTVDKYQNLFFVELLRSNIYSPELELATKEY